MRVTRPSLGLLAAAAASIAAHLALIAIRIPAGDGGNAGVGVPHPLTARMVSSAAEPAEQGVEPVPSNERAAIVGPPPLATATSAVAVATAGPAPDGERTQASASGQRDPGRGPSTSNAAPVPMDRLRSPSPGVSAPVPMPMPMPMPMAPQPAGATVAGGLSDGPRPLDDVEPAFPPEAGLQTGSVTLRLVVSAQGSVERIEVVRSSPPGVFDVSALAAFGRARFAPAVRDGSPVRAEVIYEVDFAPTGAGTENAERKY